MDAWCIGLLALGKAPEKLPEFYTHRILQFRRQDRSLIDAQVERTYKLDGKTVAKNRKKRTEQKTDSLVDWFEKQVKTFGEREAEFKRSRLTVYKAYRRYNDPDRLMPGAVFLYQGVRYVMRGRHCKGAYLGIEITSDSEEIYYECEKGSSYQAIIEIATNKKNGKKLYFLKNITDTQMTES